MGETDVTFRRLLRALPRPLLRLAFPGMHLNPNGPPIDASVDRTRQLTTDNLFRVHHQGEEKIIHVEVERDWRPKLARRMFGYASAAVMATNVPVCSVVVLLRPGGSPPSGIGIYQIPGIDGHAFEFRYHVVPLWQLDAQQMRTYLGPEGAPFCAAMQGTSEALVGALADDVRAAPDLTPKDQETTLQLLFLVAAAILGPEAARRIFHVESLIQDPNVQELIREFEARGSNRTAHAILIAVLEARSLPVTPDVRARIDAEQELAKLQTWATAAATAHSLADVFRDS